MIFLCVASFGILAVFVFTMVKNHRHFEEVKEGVISICMKSPKKGKNEE